MDDLISRQAAIDALHTHLMYRMGTDSNKKRLDEWINNLPSAQPETNCPEIPDSWVPCSRKMPEEKDTMFAKFWGTDKWNEHMFRKRSDLVEVTVELEDGTRYTDASRTRDGKWDVEERHWAVKKIVVAWKPMSEPWKGE